MQSAFSLLARETEKDPGYKQGDERKYAAISFRRNGHRW